MGTRLLAVTILTSHDEEGLQAIGVAGGLPDAGETGWRGSRSAHASTASWPRRTKWR
jgi:hypothetical protein